MENLILILCGLFGVAFQCVMKFGHLKDQATAANLSLKPKDYIQKDAVSIILSFLSVGIWFLLFGEIESKYPAIQGFLRTSFVGMGLTGSYIIQLYGSNLTKIITMIIDKKTNKADRTTSTTTIDEAVKNIANGTT